MTRTCFVVNPHAGKGKGRAVGKFLEQILARDKPGSDIVYTEGRGEAGRLAAESDAEIVVAVGGDGTINEMVNGIAGSGKILGIVPSGSGNDSIKSLKISPDPEKALETIRQRSILSVDLGWIEWKGVSGGGTRWFFNGAGIGFDAAVADRVAGIRTLRGTLLYMAAVLLALREFRPPDLRVSVDGAERLRQPMLLVAIGNGPCAGGGFFLTPGARVDDGVLDVCAITAMPAWQILRLIPKVMRAAHGGTPGIMLTSGKGVTVSSGKAFPVHTDGEVVCTDAESVSIRIHPASIRVIVPGPTTTKRERIPA